MAVFLKKMVWHQRSLRLTLSAPAKSESEILPGQRERSDATLCRALSPCSVWCRRSSRSTRSLTGRLSASLSLGSASTGRSPATSGRLQTVGNGGRQERQMAGNWLRLHSVVQSALAQTCSCARSGRWQQCDPHFQMLLSTDSSRRALT